MKRWINYALGLVALSLPPAVLVEARQPTTPRPLPKPLPGTGKRPDAKPVVQPVGKTVLSYDPRSPYKVPPKATKADIKTLQKLSSKVMLKKVETKPLEKVLRGEALLPAERATLSKLALDGREGVTQDERDIISRALDDDLERSKVPLTQRFLQLHNDTGQRLKVSLVYQSADGRAKDCKWLPGQPLGGEVIEFDLEPGDERQAKHGKKAILAARVRIWAKNAGNAGWDEWKDRDLLLVPEKDEKGNHRYYANSHEVFKFRFIKK